jgi:hypothetical protein
MQVAITTVRRAIIKLLKFRSRIFRELIQKQETMMKEHKLDEELYNVNDKEYDNICTCST